MNTLATAVASTSTNLQLILQAARGGKLREPEGDQPRGTRPIFFRDGDGGYELRYIKHREFAQMSARAQILLPVAATEAIRIAEELPVLPAHAVPKVKRRRLVGYWP